MLHRILPLRFKRVSLIALATGLAIPALAGAASFDGRPKILLHLTHPTTKGILCDRGQLGDCADAVVNGDLYPNGKSYFLFVEVHRGASLNNLAAVQLSVDYNREPQEGVDVFGWTLCLDASYMAPGVHGAWPAPLASNKLVWNYANNCQVKEAAIAGYFYLAAYSPDVFEALPIQNGDHSSSIVDCQWTEVRLDTGDLGRVAFSSGASTAGCNPCVENCTTLSPRGNPIQPLDSTPVEPTTWSAVKALFGTEGTTLK